MKILKKRGFQKKFIPVSLLGIILLTVVISSLFSVWGQNYFTTTETSTKEKIQINNFVFSDPSLEAKLLSNVHDYKLTLQVFKSGQLLWEKNSPSEFVYPLNDRFIVLGKEYGGGFLSYDVLTPLDGFYIYDISGNLIKTQKFDSEILDFKLTNTGEFIILLTNTLIYYDQSGIEKWRSESDAINLELDNTNKLILLIKPTAMPQSWGLTILTFEGKKLKEFSGNGIAPIFASSLGKLAYREQSNPEYSKWKLKVLNTIDFSETLSLDFDATPASISFAEDGKLSVFTRKPLDKETVSEKLTIFDSKGNLLLNKELGSVPLNSLYDLNYKEGKS